MTNSIRSIFLPALCAVLAAATASAQASPRRAFPFDVLTPAPAGALDLAPRADAIAGLRPLSRVTLTGVPLPDGTAVDVELQRVELAALRFDVQVDGRPVPGALDALDLSVWEGSVAGDPRSDVALAFSAFGSRGWIRTESRLVHLIAGPGERGGWAASRAQMIDEDEVVRGGRSLGDFCKIDELAASTPHSAPPRTTTQASHTLLECKVAVETDWQLNQVFGGNLTAEMTYVTTLMSWVSYRYQQQLDVVLTFPYVQFYTTSNDPWSSQENGSGAGGLLGEFQAAWQFNVPGGALVGHFISGAGLGGGVAWLPGVCNQPYNFSVCGNIDGGTSFPVMQGPGNWDFMVSAHELGHNFGAPHTHDYCPPLDECAPPGYFGGCQTQQVCTSQGTLMSYCHLCGGGMWNITTYFHPVSVSDMRNWVEAAGCLPVYAVDPYTYCQAKVNSLGCTPQIGWTGHPTLSGPDDFVPSAVNILNNKQGMFFYGSMFASLPFGGGTLCVQPPIVRTAVTDSEGSLPPVHDCSGTLYHLMSHVEMAAVGAGNTLFAQFWYRDLQSPGFLGLSDAIQFTITN